MIDFHRLGTPGNTTTKGDETSAQCHASEGAQTTEASQLDPEPRSQRVIQNFRSLFSPYPARSVPGPCSSARKKFIVYFL